jgi:hypothetical protein
MNFATDNLVVFGSCRRRILNGSPRNEGSHIPTNDYACGIHRFFFVRSACVCNRRARIQIGIRPILSCIRHGPTPNNLADVPANICLYLWNRTLRQKAGEVWVIERTPRVDSSVRRGMRGMQLSKKLWSKHYRWMQEILCRVERGQRDATQGKGKRETPTQDFCV